MHKSPPWSRRWPLLCALLAVALLASVLGARPASATTSTYSPVGVGDGSTVSSAGFAHPGVSVDRTQLKTMQKLVAEKKQPWYSAFKAMSGGLNAATDYQMKGPVAVVSYHSSGSDQYRFMDDGVAASVQAEMWYITGNTAYRDNALKIIREWSATITELSEGIHAPVGLDGMVEAAEILRYTTGSGWTDADTIAFSGLLHIATKTQANGGIDQPDAFMNQADAQIAALMDASIFLDDRTAYNDYMNRITVGVNSVPTRDGAISKQITATGQVQEMGRDQGHASFDVADPGLMAQTSYIQHTEGRLGSDGVDLYTYLDNRILKGAEYYTTYNLGDAVSWDATGAFYSTPSTAGRGVLLEATPIYNHYKYVLHIPDSTMPHLARVAKLLARSDTNPQDILQSTPADRPSAGGTVAADSGLPNSAYDRHNSGDGITAISDPDGVSVEPYTDSDGTRQIITNVQKNQWVEYGNIDLGTTPSSTLIARVGVNSSAGAKITVHLGSLTGTTVSTINVPETGWQTNWATVVTKLSEPLSGTQNLFFVWSGTANVYGWAGGMNWFKLAPYSAQVSNSVASAPTQSGVSAGPGGTGLTFADGGSVGYFAIDFDNGSQSVSLRVNTTATGSVQFRKGSATGTVVDTVALPDTGGTWQVIKGVGIGTTLLGSQDLYVTFQGSTPAAIDTFQFSYDNPTHAVTSASSYLTTVSGHAVTVPASDGSTAVLATGGTTLSYTAIDLSGSYVAVRYTATRPVTLTVHMADLSTTAVLTATLAGLRPGRWRTQFIKLPTGGAGNQFAYVTVDRPVALESFQSDPDAAAAETVTAPTATQYFVGEKISERFTVSDPYQKTATLRAFSLPAGATFDSTTDTLTWTPTASQTGTANIELLADNGTETYLSDTQWDVAASSDDAIQQVAATVTASDYTTESAQALADAVSDAERIVGGHPISYPDQPSTAADAVPVSEVLEYVGLIKTTVASMLKPFATNSYGGIDVLDNAIVNYQGDTSGVTDASLAAAFDENLSTSPNGAVHAVVDLDFGTRGIQVTGLELYPRANEAERLSGATLQASNDDTTWVTIGKLPTITSNTQMQWYTATMIDATTQYRYLRFTTIQYFHVAEVEIIGQFVDPTVLTYEQDATALLSAADYTTASWSALQSALSTAQTEAADPTTSQSQLDAATDAVRTAQLGLVSAS